MRTRLFLILMLVLSPRFGVASDEYSYAQKFSGWGELKSNADKLVFLLGVTNGYFVARGEPALYTCISHNISYEQAVAMIDKYYRDHPEQWNRAAASAMLDALTVESGPCPRSVVRKQQ